jgi:glucose-6-phosphate isomerase
MATIDDLTARWPALNLSTRLTPLQRSCHLRPGRLSTAQAALQDAAGDAARRMWRRDPSAWSGNPEVQAKITQRLGWLDSPSLMADSIERLRTFADGVKADGFTHAVLLGMGGSSLAPEVLRSILGTGPGGLQLHMLDSTDPAAVLAVRTPVEHTLYLFASKSGTTIEPNSLAAFFRQELEHARVRNWAAHFVAITDEGTELARRARDDRFRDVFINPSDIGGRYSALSFFGLVPAALMGQDVAALVGWALAMLASSEPGPGLDPQGAAALGLAMAAAAREKHDKLTLLVPQALEAFGLWIEQLVAESTGKQGVGVIPIVGERTGPASVYGDDRFFVRMKMAGASVHPPDEELIAAVEKLDAPTAEIEMPEPAALGAEFVRWEIATAIAGALLEINPFDEPNVAQAKEATRVLLSQYLRDGQLTLPTAHQTIDPDTRLTLSAAAARALKSAGPDQLLTLLRPGDYMALLAYVGPDERLAAALHDFRMAVRDTTHAASMFGYGPRYLHSTGQLHKGGPNSGVFVLVSAVPRVDFPIPGEAFSFGTLELAQSIGDFQSLDATGRRAVHIHLPDPTIEDLKAALNALRKHLPAER